MYLFTSACASAVLPRSISMCAFIATALPNTMIKSVFQRSSFT